MGMEQDMLIVRRNDFLAQLSEEDYEQLDVLHSVVIADKNAYLYFDARQHHKLYFVKEGFVRIGNIDNEGNELVRDILQPGDVFGQITLTPENLDGEFAQAHKGPVALCSFTIKRFEALLYRRPDLAVAFSKKVGQRMKRMENRLLNLLQKDVRTRLLYFFWTLFRENGSEMKPEYILPNYLTHEDIARLTGTSRQTVTSLIGRFAAEGLLEVNRHQIRTFNIKLLEKEAKAG